MSGRFVDAVVTDRRHLTDRIVELTIEPRGSGDVPVSEAGSYLEVRFGGAAGSGGSFLRHYSLVGPLTLDRRHEPGYRIAVQREDRSRGSAHIHDNLVTGSTVRVSRPGGAFRLDRRAPHVLLIAGGIGITAILPMLRSALVRCQPATMVYIGRDRDRMAYVDEVQALVDTAPKGSPVALRIHTSSSAGALDLAELLAGQPEDTVAHVCGPGRMVDAVRAAADDLGWEKRRVRHEIFTIAHKDDDVAFDIGLPDGRVVPVGPGVTMLDALEEAGVETFSDCRRGECGLCVTGVRGAEGGIDHRDSYQTPEDKAADTQVALCCSRPRGTHIEIDQPA